MLLGYYGREGIRVAAKHSFQVKSSVDEVMRARPGEGGRGEIESSVGTRELLYQALSSRLRVRNVTGFLNNSH